MLNRSSARPIRPRGAPPSAWGSYHSDDSIGSSVNETNSDTSTAKPTVIPNGKKNRPTMPFINATGMNTAITDAVVASTANPISAVPLRAAV